MKDRFKFRTVLKTDNHSIIVESEQILQTNYMIDLFCAEKEFKRKYPSESFWDFLDEIEGQPHIQEVSADCDLIITCDFTNLMQCTGLKDKNGKLIYEGDIVRTWKFSTGITQLSVIVWNEVRCGFRLYNIDNYRRNIHLYPQSMVNVTTIEVIGNIYENPELLEE